MSDSRQVSIKIEDAEVDNDIIWFFAFEYNGLYSKNMKSGEVRCHGSVPGEKVEQMRLYSSLKKVDNKIFLIPNEARELAVFDIVTDKFEKIDLNKSLGYDEYIRYMGVALYEDKLYMFGVNKPVIIEFNTETYQIKKIVDMEKTYNNTQGIYFRKQIQEFGEKLYVPFCLKSRVLELDCKTLRIKEHKIGDFSAGYSGVASDDGSVFWFVPMYCNGNIVKWERGKGVVCEIPSATIDTKFAYVGINKIGKKHVVFPSEHNVNYKRVDEQEIETAEGNYTFSKICQGVVVAYEANRNVICVWTEAGERKEIAVSVPVEYTKEKQLLWIGESREKKGMSIDFLIETMNESGKKFRKEVGEMSVGETIYHKIS